MSEPTLKERILIYIQKEGTWVASADVQRLVVQRTKDTAKTAISLMRNLTETGDLEVESRAEGIFYRATKPTIKLKSKIEVVNGVAVETFEKVPLDTIPPC